MDIIRNSGEYIKYSDSDIASIVRDNNIEYITKHDIYRVRIITTTPTNISYSCAILETHDIESSNKKELLVVPCSITNVEHIGDEAIVSYITKTNNTIQTTRITDVDTPFIDTSNMIMTIKIGSGAKIVYDVHSDRLLQPIK